MHTYDWLENFKKDECISTMEKDINVKHAKYSNTLFREII